MEKPDLISQFAGQMSLAAFMSGGRYFERWSQEESGWFNLSLKMNIPGTKYTGMGGEGGG